MRIGETNSKLYIHTHRRQTWNLKVLLFKIYSSSWKFVIRPMWNLVQVFNIFCYEKSYFSNLAVHYVRYHALYVPNNERFARILKVDLWNTCNINSPRKKFQKVKSKHYIRYIITFEGTYFLWFSNRKISLTNWFSHAIYIL